MASKHVVVTLPAGPAQITIVGGTDRDGLTLRSVAAAALGMIDVGDLDSAKAILRSFLTDR